ncbi:Protein_disulfide isomerase PDI2 [Hexamita inflata]|uniref:Protein disulfide isomerase PDI2 n=1 Tax=Hexamita inflata TaxID=28002 RepID=A0AA86P642_9EUKA|nr:Protein disulfide isomerase PDI2 [Hexamita inflata]
MMMQFLVSMAENLVLTTENFDKHQVKIVKFCNTWAENCPEFEPIWASFASEQKDVQVGEVNCDFQVPICSKYQIPRIPYVKLFIDGEVYDYMGVKNSSAALSAYVQFMLKPQFVFTDIQSCEQQFKSNYFVLYTPQLENPNFKQFKGSINLCTIKSDTLKFVSIHEETEFYSGDYSLDSLSYFVKMSMLGPVPEYTHESAKKLNLKNVSALLLNSFEHQELIQQLKNGSFNHKNEFNLVWANGHLQFMFGFEIMNEIPMGVVFNEKEGKIDSYFKKKYEGGNAMEFMNQFVQEVVEGKIPLTKVERGRRHDEL